MMTPEVLDEKVHKLLELQSYVEELNTEIESLKSELKEEMNTRGEYALFGDGWEITWNSVSSRRFDQSWFKRENSDMFEKYLTLSESRRFLLKITEKENKSW